jgi:hypothetical protein
MPVTLKSAIVATTCTVNSVVNPMPSPVGPTVPVVQQVISTPTATKTVTTLKKDPCMSAATFDVGVCGVEKYHALLLASMGKTQ